MPRKVFFSFHYERDSHRVSQIRECNSISQHYSKTPFLPKSEWESVKSGGDHTIKRWIDTNMDGTSVIVLCFGFETHSRSWVKYELEKAHKENRGIVAINLSGMSNLQQITDPTGINPLSTAVDSAGTALIFYDKYRTYNWKNDDGRNSIDEWIEKAARLVGR